jgi:hypothetical protein
MQPCWHSYCPVISGSIATNKKPTAMKRLLLFLAISFTISTAGFAQTVIEHSPQKIQQDDKQQKKHAKASKGKYDKHKHKHKHRHMHHKKK